MRDRSGAGPSTPHRSAAGPVALALGAPVATGTILQQVSPLVWVMVGLSVGGAAITYGFLVYAVWKFRDPSTRRRNYG